MFDAIRLYCQYFRVSVQAQMQYRVSFVLLTLSQFLTTGIEFVAIWALFDRFGSIKGWTLPEVALFYSLAHIAFAFADALGRGFDRMDQFVRNGELDRLLLRPRSVALQVAGSELILRRVGRLAQALVVLVWAVGELDVAWSAVKILLLLSVIGGGTCFFYALFVLHATLALWTVESLEITAAFTYGGVQTAQYPLTIYRPWFRRFFTVVLPMACVTYFPVLALLEKPDPLGSSEVFQWMAPAGGVLFLAVALQIWRIGLKHYTSTGS
ncbi:MAG: ABC-2 family transporter protein [candidate division Zixibacteria bacterium]|nr:ABC-2 family transporter protein [candidate division Zixibacteria bacterium]